MRTRAVLVAIAAIAGTLAVAAPLPAVAGAGGPSQTVTAVDGPAQVTVAAEEAELLATQPTCNTGIWKSRGSSESLLPAWRGDGRIIYACHMRPGARHWGVWGLQFTMNKCYHQSIPADGIYGPQTRAALRNVQVWLNATHDYIDPLIADGLYRPKDSFRMSWFWQSNIIADFCKPR